MYAIVYEYVNEWVSYKTQNFVAIQYSIFLSGRAFIMSSNTNNVWLSSRVMVASTPKRPVFARVRKHLLFGSGQTADSPIREIVVLEKSIINNTIEQESLEDRVSNLEKELEELKRELAPRRILSKL